VNTHRDFAVYRSKQIREVVGLKGISELFKEAAL
jgi:hypothetical protein